MPTLLIALFYFFLFLEHCVLPGQQENPSLIFPLTAMSSYQSVPKPWSSASSTGRTWAPIRAPISRSSAPTATSSNTADALAKSPSLMSALPVATAPTRLESSTHESSVGPRIVQQEEPHSYQHHKNNNQLQTSLFGELDSILGRPIHNFFFGKIKY